MFSAQQAVYRYKRLNIVKYVRLTPLTPNENPMYQLWEERVREGHQNFVAIIDWEVYGNRLLKFWRAKVTICIQSARRLASDPKVEDLNDADKKDKAIHQIGWYEKPSLIQWC